MLKIDKNKLNNAMRQTVNYNKHFSYEINNTSGNKLDSMDHNRMFTNTPSYDYIDYKGFTLEIERHVSFDDNDLSRPVYRVKFVVSDEQVKPCDADSYSWQKGDCVDPCGMRDYFINTAINVFKAKCDKYASNPLQPKALGIMAYNDYRKEKQFVGLGDIFYSSWGYEQTNITFYQVVKITAKSIYYIELDNAVDQEKPTKSDSMTAYVKPANSLSVDNLQAHNETVKHMRINNFVIKYHAWDGKSLLESYYA